MQCYALQGKRIATTSVRTGFAMTDLGDFRLIPTVFQVCHSEERSDVGIRSPRHFAKMPMPEGHSIPAPKQLDKPDFLIASAFNVQGAACMPPPVVIFIPESVH
jgi:hypothetical protein